MIKVRRGGTRRTEGARGNPLALLCVTLVGGLDLPRIEYRVGQILVHNPYSPKDHSKSVERSCPPG